MRQRAEEAGNLQSTPQEEVSQNQGAIDIAPANPQMVYVPAYDPWNAYGDPGNALSGLFALGQIGSWIGTGFMHFGPGVAMSAFLGTPWGWLGWGLDWLAHAILFHHDDYWTNSNSVRDWGFPAAARAGAAETGAEVVKPAGTAAEATTAIATMVVTTVTAAPFCVRAAARCCPCAMPVRLRASTAASRSVTSTRAAKGCWPTTASRGSPADRRARSRLPLGNPASAARRIGSLTGRTMAQE